MVSRGVILLLGLALSVSAYDNVQFFGHDAMTSEGVMKQQTLSYTDNSMPNGYLLDDMTDYVFSVFAVPANGTVTFPLEFWEGDAVFLNVHIANPDSQVRTEVYLGDYMMAGFTVPEDTATSYEIPLSMDNMTYSDSEYFTFTAKGHFSGYVYFSAVAKVYTPGAWGNDDGVIVIDLYNEEDAIVDLSQDVLRQSPDFGDDTVGLDSLYISASADLITLSYPFFTQYTDHMNVPVMMFDVWGFLADDYSLAFQIADPDRLNFGDPTIGSFFDYGSASAITQALQAQIQFPLTEGMSGVNISISSAYAAGTALSRYLRLTDAASDNNALFSRVHIEGAGYVSYIVEASDDVSFTNSQGDDAPECNNALNAIEFFTYAETNNNTEQVGFCSMKNETWIGFGIPEDVATYANPWIEFDMFAIDVQGTVEFGMLLVDDSVNTTADINEMNSMWLQNFTVGVHNPLAGGRQTIRIPMAYMEERFTGMVFTRYNPPETGKFQFYLGTMAQFFDSPKASATPTASLSSSPSTTASQTMSVTMTPTQTSSMSAAMTPTQTSSMSAAMTPSMTSSVTVPAAANDDDDDEEEAEVVIAKFAFGFRGTPSPDDLTNEGAVSVIKEVMSDTFMIPAENVEVQDVRVLTSKQVRLEATVAVRETADVDAATIADSMENVDTEALATSLNTAFEDEGVDLEIVDIEVTETTIQTTSAGFALPTLAALLAALFVAFN